MPAYRDADAHLFSSSWGADEKLYSETSRDTDKFAYDKQVLLYTSVNRCSTVAFYCFCELIQILTNECCCIMVMCRIFCLSLRPETMATQVSLVLISALLIDFSFSFRFFVCLYRLHVCRHACQRQEFAGCWCSSQLLAILCLQRHRFSGHSPGQLGHRQCDFRDCSCRWIYFVAAVHHDSSNSYWRTGSAQQRLLGHHQYQ